MRDPRVLAFLVCCDACGESTRIAPDCDLYASWAVAHMLPRIVSAEVLAVGGFRRVPVRQR